ncbi:MAG: glycosyltransferase [Sedimentisphaerales bacterium]
MDLSIVIPALNESKKIARDIKMAAEFLEGNNFQGEIIVVDDGSTDGTCEVAKSVKVPPGVRLSVIRYQQHRGKGYAVRQGIKQTSGEYVMFADSGYCVPYGNALLGLELLKDGSCDLAHGSRKLIESDIQQAQPWGRRISSRLFKWLVNKLLQIPRGLTDTQCGFKIYKGDVARQLYSQCISDGFMFDIEIILRAQKQGYRIKEFPIAWVCDPDSRLKLSRIPWPVLSEIRAIKRTLSDK